MLSHTKSRACESAQVPHLRFADVNGARHEIGLMAAYAYAALYLSEVDRIALMDALLPGVAIGIAEPDLSAIYSSQIGFARVCSWVLVALFVLSALERRPRVASHELAPPT
jgi:hypothetical protein